MFAFKIHEKKAEMQKKGKNAFLIFKLIQKSKNKKNAHFFLEFFYISCAFLNAKKGKGV